MTNVYESLPKIAKILIQIFLGAVVGGIYRIFRFTETKNTVTLVAGIVSFIPGICAVTWILDLITEILYNKITFLAD